MISSLNQLDIELFFLINRKLENAFFDFLMPLLREGMYWIPLYVFFLIVLIRIYKQKFWIWLVGVILAVGMADYVSSGILKPTVKRLRPCHNAELQHELILRKTSGCGGKYGFASSHAANHMAIAICISFAFFGNLRNRWTSLLIAWALLIGFAQIYVGVHYPGDVLVGATIGLLSGLLMNVLVRKLQSVIKPSSTTELS